MLDKAKIDVRVAMPGIVQSFDATEQTVTVQPAIREKVRDQHGNIVDVALPILLDVPIVMPRAGGYALTLPVQVGDECLVILGDTCLNAWWAQGGVQNQEELRRHDLSDAIAILGPWSQPRVLSGYNTSAAELRTEDGATKITLETGAVTITAGSVTMHTTGGTYSW